jgi:hypothetical protein
MIDAITKPLHAISKAVNANTGWRTSLVDVTVPHGSATLRISVYPRDLG